MVTGGTGTRPSARGLESLGSRGVKQDMWASPYVGHSLFETLFRQFRHGLLYFTFEFPGRSRHVIFRVQSVVITLMDPVNVIMSIDLCCFFRSFEGGFEDVTLDPCMLSCLSGHWNVSKGLLVEVRWHRHCFAPLPRAILRDTTWEWPVLVLQKVDLPQLCKASQNRGSPNPSQ